MNIFTWHLTSMLLFPLYIMMTLESIRKLFSYLSKEFPFITKEQWHGQKIGKMFKIPVLVFVLHIKFLYLIGWGSSVISLLFGGEFCCENNRQTMKRNKAGNVLTSLRWNFEMMNNIVCMHWENHCNIAWIEFTSFSGLFDYFIVAYYAACSEVIFPIFTLEIAGVDPGSIFAAIVALLMLCHSEFCLFLTQVDFKHCFGSIDMELHR